MLSVFPAPAGINRFWHPARLSAKGVPRASGDKPGSGTTGVAATLCSPRQRG
ncbi:TPA: hypothetical protein IG050_000593 [Escherichia coli]|nr:hypothetical protein [Escherichia coli]EFI1406826.1 hypothetical protein [Escherichia coli]EFJ6121421.1 hypothetical protein [Escherichia coli]EFL6969529.1 hypothetical protein [Escherichia coli]EHE7498420.1 hypothetical protein [Escherichia coli]